MKRARCERSAVTPVSGCPAGNAPQTAHLNGEPEAGAHGAGQPEQQAAAGDIREQAPAAATQPMPFPGPFAYMSVPALIEQQDSRTSIAPPALQSADSATRGPVMASSKSLPPLRKNSDRLPPLIVAAQQGDLPKVQALLQSGHIDVNEVEGKYGASALILAALEGHAEVVRTLLKHPDIAVDQADNNSDTAIMWAGTNNEPEVAACLLDAGASMKLVNCDGRTAMSMAVRRNNAAVTEVFLRHGAHPDPADLHFLPCVFTPKIITIADLCAEPDIPAPEAGVPAHPLAFFSKVISILHADEWRWAEVRWLQSRGIGMACAQQISNVLAMVQVAWQPYSPTGERANTLQKLSYGLSALGHLRAQAAGGRVLTVYRAGGISAAAVVRLTASAVRQLENLGALALAAAAELGGNMLNELVDVCLALTGLDYRVDADALKARLIRDGYCGPLAEVIALGWQEAIAAMTEKRVAMPDALTLGQVMAFLRNQTAKQASALFGLALQRQLRSREHLTSLRAMLGAGDDEGVHALFQVQCDQLRQYCAQLIGEEKSNSPWAPGD